MIIQVKVKPRSRKEEIIKLSGNTYEVKVNAPPEGGRANNRLIELLAEYFRVPKRSITIIRGHTSKVKLLEIKE